MVIDQKHNSLPKRLLYVFVAAFIVTAIWYFTRPDRPQVQLIKVERGLVEATINNTRAGTIKACHRAKLSAPAGGQISHLFVKKGERVKKGQVLLELWNHDLQAQARLTQEQLLTAQDQALQACLQADLVKKEAKRAQQLQARGFLSNEGLDQKLSAAKVARAGCKAARSIIKQGNSRLTAAQATLDRLVLRAPFNGIVADINGELGEYTTPSPPGIPTPPAIDLIDDSCLFVSAPIDEVDAASVKIAQVANITLDAIKGKIFAGRVQRIAPYVLELEKQARTVEVEVAFTQPLVTKNLLIGYSADVEIIHASHKNVLRIPTAALLEGHRVLRYADGVLEERKVSTGLANWNQTEITAGLSEGDKIVLSLDQEGVKAGARVKATEK